MGPENEKDERPDRKPEDLQDEGRTLSTDERPVMEELGDAPTGEHSG